MQILTQKSNSSAPSLEAGDPVRNSLLTLATQLKRTQPIPEPAHHKNPYETQLPRVKAPKSQPNIVPQDDDLVHSSNSHATQRSRVQ